MNQSNENSLSVQKRGWTQVKLEDVAIWGSGGTPSRKRGDYFRGNILWIKTGELNNKYIEDTEEKITEEAIRNSSAKVFPKGSVAIAMYGATIGKTSILGADAASNQACAIAQPVEPVLFNEYLYYYLLSQNRAFVRLGKGGAQPNISQTILKEHQIPLPPVAEQYRIVDKIEELLSDLDDGIKSLKTAQQQLKVYRQAVLKWAFEGKLTAKWREEQRRLGKLESADTLLEKIKEERSQEYQKALNAWNQEVKSWNKRNDVGTKPKKPRKSKELSLLTSEEIKELPKLPDMWSWQRLGSVVKSVFDGPFGSNLKTKDYTDSGVRVIRLENIGFLSFDSEKETYISEEKYNSLVKHTVGKGDIIFSSFVSEEVRATVLPEIDNKAIAKADCFCIRTDHLIRPEWLVYAISRRYFYNQIKEGIHGFTRPRINTTHLKNIPIPLCSIEEQSQISEEIEARFSTCERLDLDIVSNLEKAEALRQSILKRAFEGRLVPQDVDDEPASVLIQRIREERKAETRENKRPSGQQRERVTRSRRTTRMTDLLKVLESESDWLTAQEAFGRCGIADNSQTDAVEKIYLELRKLVKGDRVEVERRGDEDYLRIMSERSV